MADSKRALSPAIDEDAFALFEEPNFTGTPERNLLMAILERAIRDYVGNSEQEANEAQTWLFDKTDAPQQEFSFVWICQQLDLIPEKISGIIEAMPKRGEHRTAPWYFLKEAS